MRKMLQTELPREWNENRYLSECDIDLNPAMRLEKRRAEIRATSRIGQRNAVICFCPECKCRESWCRAVAHRGLSGYQVKERHLSLNTCSLLGG